MRSSKRTFSLLVLLCGCAVPNPVVVTPSFQATPALFERNPSDIAVLQVEDGTADGAASRLCGLMRQVLMSHLPDRLYAPLSARVVDAALSDDRPAEGQTALSPAYLKRIGGKVREDAVLAVRIDRWDESSILVDNRVRFQLQAAMSAPDGELLWQGGLTGEIKAGGQGAAPRDREAMARSCAEIAMIELLNHLQPRRP
ncbi:MAG: hypothetical protein Fur0037_10160 [Planctomycetota bacterium]